MNKTGIITALFLLPVALFANPDSTEQAVSTESMTSTEQPAANADTLHHFTSEELAKYNGKDNSPIYVAINDTVYDLTNVKAWKNGKHHGNKAGMDLSEKIKKSPHGTKVLKDKKVVGILVKKSE